MKKILIIRFSSIGDIVLTTTVVRCLKKQLPGAEIYYLTKPEYKTILENNPYIDHLHVLDKPLIQKSLELRKIGFDCIIDLHRNFRTKVIKTIIGTKNHIYDKLNFEKWLMVNFKINMLPKLHIVDRYMETVATLGVVNDGDGLNYFINENDFSQAFMETFHEMSLQGKKYIAFAIGAHHFTKKLPDEKIISICKLINKPVVLLGGKEDKIKGDEIANRSGSHVTNLCGTLSLNESAYMLRQSEKVITHDTGLMHIAAAFQKEIISVWGNTIPEFGMTPYYGKSDTVHSTFEIQNLACRPCSKIGFDQCPKGHFNCMMMQNENAIASPAF